MHGQSVQAQKVQCIFKTLDCLHMWCRFGLRIASEHMSSTFLYPICISHSLATATGTTPAGLLHVWDSW